MHTHCYLQPGALMKSETSKMSRRDLTHWGGDMHPLSQPSHEARMPWGGCRYWAVIVQPLCKHSSKPALLQRNRQQQNARTIYPWLKSTGQSQLPHANVSFQPSIPMAPRVVGTGMFKQITKSEAGRGFRDKELTNLYPTHFTCSCTSPFTACSMKPQ